MEDQMPDLPAVRQCRIYREIQEINVKLDILKARLEEADQTKWKGIPDKTPLW